LNIRNPKIVDFKRRVYNHSRRFNTDREAVKAKKEGYDGLVIKNVIDGVAVPATDYVVFSPEQIKSATDNVGTFDTGYKSVLYSKLEYADNGKRIKQQEILRILKNQADLMDNVPFTRGEYNKLFPSGYIESPVETVKIGANQYENLKEKSREKYLGAMRQTLKDTVIILEETVNGKKSHLYIKSFKDA
jgi:hypothetical protein